MAELDEFNPTWNPGDLNMEAGEHVLQVEVKRCSFFDTSKEKPYMAIVYVVIGENKKGFEFEDRVYVSKKAEWRARWFLKKFEYPQEYLDKESPTLKKAVIEGLRGKVLAVATIDNVGMLKIEVKKFDHLNGDEIEKELTKKNGTAEQIPFNATSDAEPTRAIDVNADVREQPAAEPDATLLD